VASVIRMVAIGTSNRKGLGRCRFSPVAILFFFLGASIIYVLILMSFAIGTYTNAVDSRGEILQGPGGTHESKTPNSLSSHLKQDTNLAMEKESQVKPGNVNPFETKEAVSPPSKTEDAILAPAQSSEKPSAVSGPRGRTNFRNVVVPNLFGNRGRMAGWMAKPRGEGVEAQSIVPAAATQEETMTSNRILHSDPGLVLKAYVEPIDFKEWETKPLPHRSTATADQLEEIAFPKLNSCQRLPEMIPADEYPEHDPFLPWIHDVFPTHDGKFIQFVAQNRRRCHTGTTDDEKVVLHLMQPNVALFQHVPVKRVLSAPNETRYRLASHDEADADGIATRFICRFKPSMKETLSVYNFDYDYVAHRKRVSHTFKYSDGGILSVHLSQLIFRCPVPAELVDIVKSGVSVKDDRATLFVDVIPIRTPPRYGFSNEFLQPKYADRLPEKLEDRFDPGLEWGNSHVLPRIEDSGRWENFPICKPTLRTFYSEHQATTNEPTEKNQTIGGMSLALKDHTTAPKKHRLVACLWASAGYTTRGNRFAVNDGQRRMLEWITFNKLLGFEHFYLYDNSYALSNSTTLKPIADMFPNDITYIKWPFQVCNNNPNNVDSPGERSSQYAAESSCRLRFGPHVEWIGQVSPCDWLFVLWIHLSSIFSLYLISKHDFASLTRMNTSSQWGIIPVLFLCWTTWKGQGKKYSPLVLGDLGQEGILFST
jgi:Glycosyltransferase family 92